MQETSYFMSFLARKKKVKDHDENPIDTFFSDPSGVKFFIYQFRFDISTGNKNQRIKYIV